MKRPDDAGWRAAMHIIERLRERDHVALLAGGCVRDLLLSGIPKDYDVATDATPEQVLAAFPKARMVGAKFGVVLVRKFRQDVEVATFRTEGPYSDGRRPDHVTYTTPEQDARRRDFTINGLFFDPVAERVLDYVGGQEDLRRRILRTIGKPEHRFSEDHLRMLRAVRLAARLRFAIDPPTAEAIGRSAGDLRRISPERIWMELEQILVHPTRATGWKLARELGLSVHLSASWPADNASSVPGADRLAALPAVEISAQLGLACLLCDLDEKTAAEVCRSLRLSNRLTANVTWLVRSLPRVHAPEALELADLKLLMAHRCWPDLLSLLRADLGVRGGTADVAQAIEDRAAAIAPDKVAPPPLLTGEDLLRLGYTPGPKFGEVLSSLYRRQLNEELVRRDEAVAEARKLLSNPR